MRVIDVHAHVIPPALVASMRAGDAPDDIRIEAQDSRPWVVHRQGYRYPLLNAFHDVQARLDAMDAAGVDVAVLSSPPTLFLYWIDAASAADAARVINDAIAAMVAQAPTRFTGVATLPLQDPGVAAVELRRCVRELGMCGAQIGPHAEGLPLDDGALRPVLDTAVELGVPLIIHPYYVGSSPGLDGFYLTNLQGNPWQTAVCASRLILSGTLDALPSLEVVLVHGGGHLPYQIGRLDHGHKVRPEAQAPLQAPSAYLRRFHYDTLTHRPASTRWLIDQVGADRVLYGTDMPFDMGGGPLREQLAGFPLSDEALTAVAHTNAERLFALDGVLNHG
ncbi:MAG: amidohydrolase family protein [Micromonospora sp.]